MHVKELIIGQTAMFNHCDAGWIDVEITDKGSIGQFYIGKLKKVHHKEVRMNEVVSYFDSTLSQGQTLYVFVQPSDLLCHN